ncbi:MAG: hypothetical protein L0Y56_15260, partial [Nitrospira sp.]|nr:hypothetical protein [Nitrospira sp.]
MSQPEGRRDTPNHECPPAQFFDFKRRECIPLNKDTVMASEDVDDEFKKVVATSFARLALTSPDPMDGHRHVATLDEEGNGVTSVAGFMHLHSHEVDNFNVIPRTGEKDGQEYISQHPGVAVPVEMRLEKLEDAEYKEESAPLKGGQRKALPTSSFGVPGKRKFPLDSCNRVRNAMARFNQAKGLTASEKATLRRKIMGAAKKCGIEVRKFTKATTAEEFANVLNELLLKERIVTQYAAKDDEKKDSKKGPCPPFLIWDPKTKKCGKMKGFHEIIRAMAQATNSDPTSKDPEGRKDTPGFKCPEGQFFDFKNRKCLPLDPSKKDGTTTSKAAEEDAASRNQRTA